MSDEVLQYVLDAGELSHTGEGGLLSQFATSYLYLRSKGVPVHDVITMAKQHGRKINLWWSPTRWQEEHQKLSQLATLQELSKENKIYDVEWAKRHLPANNKYSIIKTSRRLGLEGMRQRHCVASYGWKLKDKKSVILSVLHDKKRWTVELLPNNNENTKEEFPLLLNQIRTVRNGTPSGDQREAILKIINIDSEGPKKSIRPSGHRVSSGGTNESANSGGNQELPRDSIRPTQPRISSTLRDQYSNSESQLKDTALYFAPFFVQAEIRSIRAEFSGAGDSGEVDCVQATSFSGSIIGGWGNVEWPSNPTIPIVQWGSRHEDGQYISYEEAVNISLDKAASLLVDKFTEMDTCDWYNNAGGNGYIDIVFENNGDVNFDASIDVNYTESITEYTMDELIEATEAYD